MDKEILGTFVSELRKEHHMTQKELAELLGVTDKAVSKWERGLSYPDISLLEPLAKTLDISVLELLQGKRIPKEEVISVAQAKQALDNSLRISDNELQRKHVVSKSIIILCCVSLMLLISIIINIRNLSNNRNTTLPSPDMQKEAYQTREDANGNPIFEDPDAALKQMLEDGKYSLPQEWHYLLEIIQNTLKEGMD